MTRLAQFGLGKLGQYELEAFERIDGVEIVAGADPFDEARADFETEYAVPSYPSHEDLLAEHGNELDAVNVVTPHALHFEQTMDALAAGLGVHLEKPMVTDVGHAVALTEAAAERDAVVQVGYQRRFDPRFRKIKEIVDSGEIGAVAGANGFLEQDWIGPLSGTWRTDPSLSGGGQLYDSGSHLLDVLLWTTGTTPRSVGAVVESNGHDVDVHSSLSLSLERDGRTLPASVFVTGDGPTGPATREGLYVWGTEGSVEYGSGGVTLRRKDGKAVDVDVPVPDFVELTERKLEAFVRAVEGKHRNPVPPEHGRDVITVTEAAYRAHDDGRTVDVQELLQHARAKA